MIEYQFYIHTPKFIVHLEHLIHVDGKIGVTIPKMPEIEEEHTM